MSAHPWIILGGVVAVVAAIAQGGLGLSKESRFPDGIDGNGDCVNLNHDAITKRPRTAVVNLCPGTQIDYSPRQAQHGIGHMPRQGERRANIWFSNAYCPNILPSERVFDYDVVYCTMLYGSAIVFAPGRYIDQDEWPAGLRLKFTFD